MIVFANGRERKNREILDIFVFSLLTLLLPLFTIGKIIKEGTGENPYRFDGFLPTNSVLFFPLVVLFVLLAVFFIFRRTPYLEKTRKRNVVLLLFVAFVISRLFGILLFPEGLTEFTFTSKIYKMTATVSYDFLPLTRTVTFFQDFCLGFYFFLLFGYTDTLGRKFSILANIILVCLILIAFLTFAYAMVKQRDIVTNNFYALIGKEGYQVLNLESFTGHKNTYGFLMTLACFACFLFFAKKPNPLLPLIVLFCFFNTLLCGSRTATYLCFSGIVAYCFLYPFLGFKTNKISAGCFIVVDVAVLAFVTYSLTRPETHPIRVYFDNLLRKLTDLDTVNARINHWETGLAMMNEGFFQLFGYGRYPFLSLYRDFQIAIHAEINVVTSHNGYLQTYIEFGVMGALCSALLVLYMIYMILRLFTKNQKVAFAHLLVTVLTLVHCYVEPRFFLLDEGSNILLLFACLLPLMREYHDQVLVKKGC